MKRFAVYLVLIVIVLIGLSMVSSSARAAPHATYTLVKSSVGSGGSNSAGIYTISNSIGQPIAGEVSAGIYTLGGGFWGGGVIVTATSQHIVYLPLVLR